MDHDWHEVARIPLPPPGVLAHSTPVSTLAFDTSHELLWAGNEYGRVSSFYGPELTMYTSFKAHGSQGGQVHQLLFNARGVIALGSRSIHMALRRGAPLWNIKHDDMKELRCMTWTSKGTAEILVAGEQDKMFIIDVNKGEISKVLPTSHHYKIMRRSRYICAATTGPVVHILDPLNFSIVKEWTAHAASISDMDAQHDIIVTCGMSPRTQGYTMFDPLVNAFDLKQMASMPPVPFPSGAAYVRMHPRMSTTSIVVSQSGQMHVVDLFHPELSTVKQANHFSMKLFDIAPSGEAIALADTDCAIHLWGHQGKLQFAELPNMVDVPTPSDPLPQLDFKDDTPLNTIGMPYYREQLLSAWPKDEVYDIGAPPPKEDLEVLKSLTQRTWGYYGKNFRNSRRNQVEDTRKLDNERELLTRPKFLSEQAREMSHTPAGTPPPEEIAPGPRKAIIPAVLESHKAEVPPMYRNIEIQFSKFGIDDWDFKHFNATQYSGLQNHIVNSYVNALLQIMHFTPAIRNVALRHAATGCIDEWCLLCELGFLFDMLDKGEGAPCHASNLLKIFGRHDQAAKLGLLEDSTQVVSRTLMLQGFSRFLLDKLVTDHKRMAPESSTVEQLFETSAISTIRCNSCSSETSKPGSTLVHELMYSQNASEGRERQKTTRANALQKPGHRNAKTSKVTFSQVLKKSVEREVTNKGWCQICHKYQTLSTKKQIHSIPTVLTLLAGMPTDEYRKLWASPGWLPEEIGVIIKYGQFFCYEGEELKYQLQRGYHDMAVYSLTGVATNIETGQVSRPHHLVAMANVAHSAPVAPGESQWYLLNDFHIKRVPGEEALAFNTSWKMPSVITFQRKEANNQLDLSWKENLDTSLLYMDRSLVFPGHEPQVEDKTYRILDRETEQPSPETIIAIDTEFVSTSRQVEMIESETNESRIVRPVVHALARISVLRGSGHLEGVPFIDDYIHIREPVIDYLTAYSGILPGDLDPAQTRHNLVALKVAYKKMWILLNLGCKFLGHGLKQDFRVINIHVPQGQIIDTSDLFFSQARKRKLSLQFLAWCLLQEKIQLETHDSIEDARTALRLYRKYEEFIDAGILDMIMLDVFQKGAAYNFRPPLKNSSDGGTAGPPITPRKNVAQAEFSGSSPGWTPTLRPSAPTPGR